MYDNARRGWFAILEQHKDTDRGIIDAMEKEVINGTDITKEGQGQTDAIVVPEFLQKFEDLDLSEVGEDSNGTVGMLYGLYSDHIDFKFYGTMADDIVAGSRRVKGEVGHSMPGPAHDEGRVATGVLNCAADQGGRIGVWVLEVSEGKVAWVVN